MRVGLSPWKALWVVATLGAIIAVAVGADAEWLWVAIVGFVLKDVRVEVGR